MGCLKRERERSGFFFFLSDSRFVVVARAWRLKAHFNREALFAFARRKNEGFAATSGWDCLWKSDGSGLTACLEMMSLAMRIPMTGKSELDGRN
jgi:hypothetical protein